MGARATIKILVIDDHPIVRDGMTALLRHGIAASDVFQAASAEEGLQMLDRHPDLAVLLLDMAMPGLSGTEAIDAFRHHGPGLAIVVISAHEAPDDVRRALAHGARGFIPKSARPQTLLAAIRLVLAGELYVPPAILESQPPGSEKSLEQGTKFTAEPHDKMTPRQIEILDQLSAGHANKEIALTLGITEKTVKAHVGAIFRILGVVNRTQAAAVHRAKPR